MLAFALSACAGKAVSPRETLPGLTDSQLESSVNGQQLYAGSSWRDTWLQLSGRLQQDGLDPGRTRALFARLDMPPSPIPMGAKVRELYTSAYLPRPKARPPKAVETKLGIPGPWFKGVVTRANALTCRAFMEKHAMAFARAELRYGVPSEVAAALLFVETRLGSYLGRHNAFYMLASMSVTRAPESIPEYINRLQGADRHLPWIRKKMETKADWAYRELRALLKYCYANGIDPLAVKGSIYGAIGLCQFMPSNLPRYAVDGNNDGVVDIFTVDDAVASLSNYLAKNGWKQGMSLERQVRVLRSYNAMDIYAHTILALAKTIKQVD